MGGRMVMIRRVNGHQINQSQKQYSQENSFSESATGNFIRGTGFLSQIFMPQTSINSYSQSAQAQGQTYTDYYDRFQRDSQSYCFFMSKAGCFFSRQPALVLMMSLQRSKVILQSRDLVTAKIKQQSRSGPIAFNSGWVKNRGGISEILVTSLLIISYFFSLRQKLGKRLSKITSIAFFASSYNGADPASYVNAIFSSLGLAVNAERCDQSTFTSILIKLASFSSLAGQVSGTSLAVGNNL